MEFEEGKEYWIRTPTKEEWVEVEDLLSQKGMGWNSGKSNLDNWEEHEENSGLSFGKNRNMGYCYVNYFEDISRYIEITKEDLIGTIEEKISGLTLYIQKDDVTITDNEGDVITISKKQLKEIYEKIK